MNVKRKGLLKLISQAENQEIGRIFTTHKERLTRFGFGYLLKLFSILDVQIIVLNQSDDKSPQEDLAADLIQAIVEEE